MNAKNIMTKKEKVTFAFKLKNSIFDMLECVLLVEYKNIDELSALEAMRIASCIATTLKDCDIDGSIVSDIIKIGYEEIDGILQLLYPSNYEVVQILKKHNYF